MADLAAVAALAVEVATSATRAGARALLQGFDNDSYRGLVFTGFDPVSSNSYLTKYWGHGDHSSSFGLMSPIFDEEPPRRAFYMQNFARK